MFRGQQMKKAPHDYLEAFNTVDIPKMMTLYSDNAIIEDPYGTPPRVGKAAIEAFYREALVHGAQLRLSAPVRASYSDAAAMAFEAMVERPEGTSRVDIIDVMTFDEAGLIGTMHAYFGGSDISASTAS